MLNKKKSIEFIQNESKQLEITAYEFGTNTEISTLAASKILKGETKNPNNNTLNVMIQYIEFKSAGIGINPPRSHLNEPPTEYKPIKSSTGVVPYYNIEISGSCFKGFKEADQHIEFYIDYKPLNDCTAYIPYFGQSMEPIFKSGNTLAVKEIFNFDVILWGESYFVITDKYANCYKTVKCIHQHSDNSKIILRAINPNYSGDIVVSKMNILKMYLVKGRIELNEL